MAVSGRSSCRSGYCWPRDTRGSWPLGGHGARGQWSLGGHGRSRDKVRERTGEERPLAEVFVERKEGPSKWHNSTDIASIVFIVV